MGMHLHISLACEASAETRLVPSSGKSSQMSTALTQPVPCATVISAVLNACPIWGFFSWVEIKVVQWNVVRSACRMLLPVLYHFGLDRRIVMTSCCAPTLNWSGRYLPWRFRPAAWNLFDLDVFTCTTYYIYIYVYIYMYIYFSVQFFLSKLHRARGEVASFDCWREACQRNRWHV